jgi:hypothetical protein
MRIDSLRREVAGDRVRIGARVSWEETDRADHDLYFETETRFGNDLTDSADPFVIATMLPAFRHGERRVRIDADVSPELFEGLETVTQWLSQWFHYRRPAVLLDAPAARHPAARHPAAAAGFFFSGGVDSLAALRANRRTFPNTHPGALRDGLLVYGLEVEQPEAFAHALGAVGALAADADVTLVPVYTNVRRLDDDWVFYRDQFQGAILAAVGHALARRLAVLSIAATYDAANLAPWGSHPLLDPNFSTYQLRIHHQGVAMSRLEKVRLLLDWPAALAKMRVCNKAASYRADMLNCGECEKCVRTMLELIALGALDRATAFSARDLTSTALANVYIGDDYVAACYADLVAPLHERGRGDLAHAIEQVLAGYRGETGYRGALKRFDRLRLNSGLRTLKRAVLPGRDKVR